MSGEGREVMRAGDAHPADGPEPTGLQAFIRYYLWIPAPAREREREQRERAARAETRLQAFIRYYLWIPAPTRAQEQAQPAPAGGPPAWVEPGQRLGERPVQLAPEAVGVATGARGASVRPGVPGRQRNARTSVWMLLLAEAMFFFGLLSSFFFLRSNLPAWGPPTGRGYDLLLPSVNTVLLLASIAPMYLAYQAIRNDDRQQFNRLLLAAMGLGAAFIVGQVIEFSRLGFAFQDGAYAGIFVLTIGMHAAHVAVGVLIFVVVQLRAALGLLSARRHLAVELCAIYWYFVALIWIVIFAILYFV